MKLGIDLGGTKIEIAIFSDTNDIEWKKRVMTPVSNYSQVVETLRQLIEESLNATGFKGPVGMSIPGSESPANGLIRGANSQVLNGKNLVNDVENCSGREVRVANDANCFVLSESTDGSGQKANSVFGVIIGTGCGGGLVLNKQLVSGFNNISGEWGHNPLPWQTESELKYENCWCGLKGCLETYISGTAVSKDYKKLTGIELSVQEILDKTLTDEIAELVIKQLEDRLSRALSTVINMIDPEIIVLGGGLSNIERLYDSVPKLWNKYVFSDLIETRLLKPMYGDSSGIRGAAWLWNDI
jgi:fructokinase